MIDINNIKDLKKQITITTIINIIFVIIVSFVTNNKIIYSIIPVIIGQYIDWIRHINKIEKIYFINKEK